nr:hypothetical protein [uncultured Shinella sp.]
MKVSSAAPAVPATDNTKKAIAKSLTAPDAKIPSRPIIIHPGNNTELASPGMVNEGLRQRRTSEALSPQGDTLLQTVFPENSRECVQEEINLLATIFQAALR